ncbi:hypothetical protein Ddc_10999 [Ditylenchus destructor]|nr:hypothetical protein Ddc_10999 [Ditylenchus destructor]
MTTRSVYERTLFLPKSLHSRFGHEMAHKPIVSTKSAVESVLPEMRHATLPTISIFSTLSSQLGPIGRSMPCPNPLCLLYTK